MAEESQYDRYEAEPLGTVLRRTLTPENYRRYLSIVEDYHRASVSGTYNAEKDSSRFNARFFGVIENHLDLWQRMPELPWVPFEPGYDIPSRTLLEAYYQNQFLEGLENELPPDLLCRVLDIFNEVTLARMKDELDISNRGRYFRRFIEIVGDQWDVLTRVALLIVAPRPVEGDPIPTPLVSRHTYFAMKCTLAYILEERREAMRDDDFFDCMKVWKEFIRSALDSKCEDKSRETFRQVSQVLRPHPFLMRIVLEAPWPHLHKFPSSGDLPCPDKTTLQRGD